MKVPPVLFLGLALAACSAGADDTAAGGSGEGSGAGGGEGSGSGSGEDDGSSGSGEGGDDTGDRFTDCEELVAVAGPVVISTQAGLSGFCESWNAVDGDLYLDVGATEDPITELDGIKCLCAVEGDLTITGDSSQTLPPDGAAPPTAPPPGPEVVPPHVVGDIELTLLERVGGDLILTHHPQLDFVQSLVALREVGGDIVLRDIPNLQVIKFFGLETLGGRLVVEDMGKLLVVGLEAATTVGGIQLGEAGDAETLYFLVELGLGSLEEVTGDLRLVGARNLPLLRAPELTRVGGALHLEASCVTFPSLGALTEVGSLHLEGNCGLSSLSGLAALERVTGADADGHAVRIAAQDGLDAEETQAWLDGLELEAGDASVDLETACTTVLAAYGEGYCE